MDYLKEAHERLAAHRQALVDRLGVEMCAAHFAVDVDDVVALVAQRLEQNVADDLHELARTRLVALDEVVE